MKRIILPLMLLGAAAVGCAAPEMEDPARADFSKIMRVNDVEVKLVKGGLQQLVITALGDASSAGWVEPRLVPADPPSQAGVYQFNFVASRPEGLAAQVVSPISATLTLEPAPTDLRAVMVIAESNSKTVVFQ